MDLQVYWQRIRSLQATLPEPCYITSIEDTEHNIVPGRTCCVVAEVAAQRIYDRTHRLATDEEIALYRRTLDEVAEKQRLRKLREKQIVLVDERQEVRTVQVESDAAKRRAARE